MLVVHKFIERKIMQIAIFQEKRFQVHERENLWMDVNLIKFFPVCNWMNRDVALWNIGINLVCRKIQIKMNLKNWNKNLLGLFTKERHVFDVRQGSPVIMLYSNDVTQIQGWVEVHYLRWHHLSTVPFEEEIFQTFKWKQIFYLEMNLFNHERKQKTLF